VPHGLSIGSVVANIGRADLERRLNSLESAATASDKKMDAIAADRDGYWARAKTAEAAAEARALPDWLRERGGLSNVPR